MAIALKSSKKFRSAFSKVALVSAAAFCSCPGLGIAQKSELRGDNFVYVVKPGDNLITIRAQFATDSVDWKQVAKLNKVSNDKRLPVGKEILIPISWLNAQPAAATVKSVSGKASINGQSVTNGMQILENARLVTEENSAVVLELSDGSALRVGSASTIVVDRLKQYHSPQIVEARVRLEKGRIEAAVTENRKKPLDIITPGATAAVRGTNFGVSLDASVAGTPAAVDVSGGNVAWIGAKSDARESLPGGFGSSVNAVGAVSKAETLLPPVPFDSFPKDIAKVVSEIPFPEVKGAANYRVQVAKDSGFNQVLSESVVTRPQVVLISQDDGEHFIRVRGIAPNLIEGVSSTTRVNVQARPVAPDGLSPATGTSVYKPNVTLSWLDTPGNSFRVQAAKDADFKNPILDNVTKERDASLSVPLGKFFWRVASISNGKQGPFSDAKNIELRAAPNTPVPAVKDDVIELNSDVVLSEKGNQLEIFIAKDADFKSGLEIKKITSLPAKFTLPAGNYFLKTRYLIEGFKPDAVPFGPTQTVKMVEPVRDSFGNTIRSIDGSSIILGR
jgi:hypothetical protein